MKIKKDMKIAEVVKKYPKTAEVFLDFGLVCFSCHMAQIETVEDGAKSHGINVNKLIKALNNKIKK